MYVCMNVFNYLHIHKKRIIEILLMMNLWLVCVLVCFFMFIILPSFFLLIGGKKGIILIRLSYEKNKMNFILTCKAFLGLAWFDEPLWFSLSCNVCMYQ